MNIIFPRIPRTASTEARKILLNAGYTPERMVHQTLAEYSNKLCKNAFKFSFIRNPYDQIKSFYDLGKSHRVHGYNVGFRQWVLNNMPTYGIWNNLDPFDQVKFIKTPDKEAGDDGWIGLDRVYRYTYLNEAWDDLSKNIGCPKLKVGNTQRLSHLIFTDEMKGIVLSRYSHIFSLLGFDEDTGEDLVL